MMQVTAITREDVLKEVADDWRRIAGSSPYATVFQSYEWCSAWWSVFGRFSLKRLCVLIVRDDSGAVRGIAPLYKSLWCGTFVPQYSIIGNGVSDYLDFLADTSHEQDVLDAVYGWLGENRAWGLLDFAQVREGALIMSFESGALNAFRFSDFKREGCPYLPLSPHLGTENPWASLLLTFGKKMRSNIGYYERLMRRTYEVTFREIDRPRDLGPALSVLFELHSRRWNQRLLPGVFVSAKVRRFHRLAALDLLKSGHLRLYVLDLDGEPVAALYCFAWGDRVSYYQGGFEPGLSKLSPGTVLTAYAVRRALEAGVGEFDFLRGEEEYKLRWTGALKRWNSRRIVGRTPAMHVLGVHAHRIEHNVETTVKRMAEGGLIKVRRKAEK